MKFAEVLLSYHHTFISYIIIKEHRGRRIEMYLQL
jgi:hypothetical protein